jgi:c-di-GMP-related signal transduction protein
MKVPVPGGELELKREPRKDMKSSELKDNIAGTEMTGARLCSLVASRIRKSEHFDAIVSVGETPFQLFFIHWPAIVQKWHIAHI